MFLTSTARSVGFVLALATSASTLACNKSPDAAKPAPLPPSAAPAAAPSPAPAAAAPAPAAPAAAAEAETVPAAPDPKSSISGNITLPKARKKDVAKGDTLFIIARRGAGGPPMPLAVQKHQAGDFPMAFSLSSRDAMIPGTQFEGAIDIEVRVDKDGEALTTKKGDVLGKVTGVKVGSTSVTIPLDTFVAEDVVRKMPPGMGGPGPGVGTLPPGHP